MFGKAELSTPPTRFTITHHNKHSLQNIVIKNILGRLYKSPLLIVVIMALRLRLH